MCDGMQERLVDAGIKSEQSSFDLLISILAMPV
jgi:hypothetical protein